ncbi:MAG: 50S ribosomal protein L9 [Erysipelotrichaceae bacterium]|jgi:large subunit ribosomal protein L9|nr:50S ribosomal protein L9 [Erysipelotrichaceae bacterium]
MKIILLKDVRKVGKKDEVKEVSDGYARNFLIKNGYAVAYTEGSKKVLNRQMEEKQKREDELKEEALEIKKLLEETPVEFYLNTGKEGQVFGSVSSKNIVSELAKKDIKIEKRKVLLEQPITSLGTTRVKVDLYKNQVIGEIIVRVREKG